MKTKLILMLLITVVNTSCAFTVHDLPVNYEYSGNIPVKSEGLPSIRVVKVSDSRNVPNPRMIMNNKDGYGTTTSGGWQAEKDLSEIVKDALSQGISQAGLSGQNDNGSVSMNGELLDVQSDLVSGWFSGTISTKIIVKLDVKSDDTGQILWRDTFTGDATSDEGNSISELLPQAFNRSLDNLVNKLLTDQYFLQQLSK